jgi:hypothetical protein
MVARADDVDNLSQKDVGIAMAALTLATHPPTHWVITAHPFVFAFA